MNHLTDLTIVVPTRNERMNIVRFLRSLPADVKLIVVDCSEDGTDQIIEQQRPENTRVIRHNSRIAEARQMGVELANTSWVLCTDADIEFDFAYFRNLELNYLRFGERYGVIYGPKLSHDRFKTYYRLFFSGQKLIDRCGIPAASGSNLLLRKSALQAAGGFDKSLSVNEDSEVAWRIKRHGYESILADDLMVYACDHRRLERGIIKKTLHSLVRCSMLYFDVMPDRLRRSDWGYWRTPKPSKQPLSGEARA